jgi:hypothetical protein
VQSEGTGAVEPPTHVDINRCNVQTEERVSGAAHDKPSIGTRPVQNEAGLPAVHCMRRS